MKANVYGTMMLDEAKTAADAGVTAPQLEAAVRCSKAHVHNWIKKMRTEGDPNEGGGLVSKGVRDAFGAELWVYVSPAEWKKLQAKRAKEHEATVSQLRRAADGRSPLDGVELDVQPSASPNGIAKTRTDHFAASRATATTIPNIDPRSMLGVGLQVTGVRLSTGGGYVLELSGDEGVCIQIQVDSTDDVAPPVAATAKN